MLRRLTLRIRPPSLAPQRDGMFEWPISEYPSGHSPHTESRLPPKGTHWTKVGSPSLQISGALVTPVVAYPSGQRHRSCEWT